MGANERTVLTRLQGGLERMYRVRTDLDVESFVIAEELRDDTAEIALDAQADRAGRGLERRPREQVLLRQGAGDEMEIGLYVDRGALATLERHDPAHGLGPENFADFCLALEGVSHFVYLAVCASAERAVTALELELQAEVDKFVCCLLLTAAAHRRAAARELRRRLFENVAYAPDLDAAEASRYRAANDHAGRYASALERRYVEARRTLDLLAEVRAFYRMPLSAKLAHIARAA